jgi:hypothetical protein
MDDKENRAKPFKNVKEKKLIKISIDFFDFSI